MTVTLATSSVDDQDMAWLIWGQKWQVTDADSNLAVPRLKYANIPDATPYEIAVTGITANTDEIEVTIIDSVAPGKVPLTRGSSSTPASGEFSPGAAKVIFNSAQAGKRVAIYYREDLATSTKFIGGIAADYYDNLEIYARLCGGTRMGKRNIWFPKLTPNSGANLDVTADSFSKDYKALIPSELGWKSPFLVW